MFPLFWQWTPHFNYPFSGNVEQEIAPSTDWFFGAIPPQAGNGAIEQEIFNTVSYGRQIGLINTILLALAEQAEFADPKAREALQELRELAGSIATIKADYRKDARARAESVLRQLAADDPAALQEVLARFGKP
jgi:hypothetical protein